MNRARRFVYAVLVVCVGFFATQSTSAFTLDTSPATPTNVTGLWWNSSEPGWGVSLTQQGTVIFATMYTYDGAGNATWYVVSNCPVSGDGCTGDLYRVVGGRPPTMAWGSGGTSVLKVGILTLHFIDNNNGSMSFSIDGAAGFKSITRQLFGPAPPPVNQNRAKTEMLLGGTWYFTFSIISSFTYSYRFTSIAESSASPGDYNAIGTDEYGDMVIGGYYSRGGFWSVLDPGIIIDRFYTFSFPDNNHVSGCYYQVDPPGSTNMSRCYAMTGYRTPAKAGFLVKPDEGQLRREVVSGAPAPAADPAVVDDYLTRRAQLHSIQKDEQEAR